MKTILAVLLFSACASAQVWDSNYKAVVHLGGSPISVADSTGNTTPTNTGVTATTGPGATDGAGAFVSGSSTNVLLAASALNFTSAVTVEAWVYYSDAFANNHFPRLISNMMGTVNGYDLLLYNSTIPGSSAWGTNGSVAANCILWQIGNGGTYEAQVYSAYQLTNNTWYHVVGTFDGTVAVLYLNGKAQNSIAYAGTIGSSSTGTYVGGTTGAPSNAYWGGKIDEARVSNVARSANYVLTEYNNQSSPSTFYLPISAQQTSGSPWYNLGGTWTDRKQLTINHTQVGGALTNFPVLVSVTDANLQASAKSDGSDIVFTAADGITKLYHEIEKYDNTTGTLVAWVKLPSLSATYDTPLYMYYGSASSAPTGETSSLVSVVPSSASNVTTITDAAFTAGTVVSSAQATITAQTCGAGSCSVTFTAPATGGMLFTNSTNSNSVTIGLTTFLVQCQITTLVSTAVTCTITPSAAYTGTVTYSDGASGGTFTPTTQAWAAASTAFTFTYSNATPATYTLGGTGSVVWQVVGWPVAVRNATAYWLKATGSDSAAGTSGAAWLTLAKASDWSYYPGDSLTLNGGDTFTGQFAPDRFSGTPGVSQVVLASGGTGQATIFSAYHDGIKLTDQEAWTVNNLVISGQGWAGTMPSPKVGAPMNVYNGETAIHEIVTRTSGQPLRSIAVTNNTITGFWEAVMWGPVTAGGGQCNGCVGFAGVTIAGNTMSHLSSGSVDIESYLEYNGGGPANQNKDIYIGHNTFSDIVGDPWAGHGIAGTVHGPVSTDGGAVAVNGTTGAVVEYNYFATLGGFGSSIYNNGGLGGSTAFVAENSTGLLVLHNEITKTACASSIDGSAFDFDFGASNWLLLDNVTYNNVGPFLQWNAASSTSLAAGNISYNDVRGNSGSSNQGAIRVWGSGAPTIANNTIIMQASGTVGTPTAVSFDASITVGAVNFLNNIFWTDTSTETVKTNSVSIAPTTWVQNDYYCATGTCDISNYGTSHTLANWRSAGTNFEAYGGISYGTTANPQLTNPTGFAAPVGGFLAGGTWPTVFDAASGSSLVVAAGADPWLIGSTPPNRDFHDTLIRNTLGQYPIGAVTYPQPTAPSGGSLSTMTWQ